MWQELANIWNGICKDSKPNPQEDKHKAVLGGNAECFQTPWAHGKPLEGEGSGFEAQLHCPDAV